MPTRKSPSYSSILTIYDSKWTRKFKTFDPFRQPLKSETGADVFCHILLLAIIGIFLVLFHFLGVLGFYLFNVILWGEGQFYTIYQRSYSSSMRELAFYPIAEARDGSYSQLVSSDNPEIPELDYNYSWKNITGLDPYPYEKILFPGWDTTLFLSLDRLNSSSYPNISAYWAYPDPSTKFFSKKQFLDAGLHPNCRNWFSGYPLESSTELCDVHKLDGYKPNLPIFYKALWDNDFELLEPFLSFIDEVSTPWDRTQIDSGSFSSTDFEVDLPALSDSGHSKITGSKPISITLSPPSLDPGASFTDHAGNVAKFPPNPRITNFMKMGNSGIYIKIDDSADTEQVTGTLIFFEGSNSKSSYGRMVRLALPLNLSEVSWSFIPFVIPPGFSMVVKIPSDGSYLFDNIVTEGQLSGIRFHGRPNFEYVPLQNGSGICSGSEQAAIPFHMCHRSIFFTTNSNNGYSDMTHFFPRLTFLSLVSQVGGSAVVVIGSIATIAVILDARYSAFSHVQNDRTEKYSTFLDPLYTFLIDRRRKRDLPSDPSSIRSAFPALFWIVFVLYFISLVLNFIALFYGINNGPSPAHSLYGFSFGITILFFGVIAFLIDLFIWSHKFTSWGFAMLCGALCSMGINTLLLIFMTISFIGNLEGDHVIFSRILWIFLVVFGFGGTVVAYTCRNILRDLEIALTFRGGTIDNEEASFQETDSTVHLEPLSISPQ